MANLGKAVPAADFRFHVGGETFLDFHHPGATAADKVVMMTVIALGQQFEASHAVAEVKPPDEAHFLQRVQVAIDCGQIAALAAKGGVDLLVAQRMLMPAQDIQDGLAWRGDLSGALA
jgi:hypothetical protein